MGLHSKNENGALMPFDRPAWYHRKMKIAAGIIFLILAVYGYAAITLRMGYAKLL
jgi:hypothetical protein